MTAPAASGSLPDRPVIELEHGITVYPPRTSGGRWRAVWYEDGRRRQCEAASEDRLAAKLDKVTERFLGNAKIGTTGRGIGPTYGDKIARVGIRVQDLFDPGILRQKLDLVLRDKNQLLTKVYNRRGIDAAATAEEYLTYGERLKPYVADTGLVLGNALDNDEVVLLEGAQATMLDVDHGTYPFVTSSSPTAGGACAIASSSASGAATAPPGSWSEAFANA